MAINRVLNAIWAEISARGSLIKTATNPYNPSPGTTIGNGDSNNQGMNAVAAISSQTPFTLVDANGVSSGVDVGTSLANAPTNPTPPLDENSGQYQVVRQYGDIYLYNDGNIIAWGGNGKNFNFGNGYEEAHGWAGLNCVYNNETFTIPIGALSIMALTGAASTTAIANANLPSNPQSEWELLGGMISKSWGIEYSYAYGASYEWNGGPNNYMDAFGSVGDALKTEIQGKHCTYSYGTGYEEALIEWTPSSNYFHADDLTSPYLSRSSDNWQSSNLGTSWTAANLLVSKAFGPSYEYHYGSALSIQEGPSEERVNGASWSTVNGNSTETVTGNSSETVTGNSTSTVNGNSNETITGNSTSKTVGNKSETYWGLSDEYFMGGKSEMMLAGCDEINLAAKVEIVGGAATEIFLGAKLEMVLAVAMELKGGMGLSITTGQNVEMNLGKLEIEDTASIDVKTSGITAALLNLFS